MAVIRGLLVLATFTLVPATALAGLKVYEKDDMSLELGLRMQPRWEYDRVLAAGGGTEWQRDFLIRRTRLKANGKINGATYGFEWKIDGTDQIGQAPAAAVENAWMQYPMSGVASLRAGLFDAPFSRDLLTSDSKQLAVDRGAVSAVPSAHGLVDNVVGFDVRGQAKASHFQYVLGFYDNRVIPGRRQDVPMVVGRVDLNFGSTKDIYQDAHFGKDKWYCIGINASGQSSIDGAVNQDSLHIEAAGVDGMVDVPMGAGRLFVRGEINAMHFESTGGTGDKNSTVRMIGAGYLMFNEHLQPFVRFDQVRGDLPLLSGVVRDITYVGANLYQKGHSLKIQGDVRFQSGTNESVDGARLQAQIDF